MDSNAKPAPNRDDPSSLGVKRSLVAGVDEAGRGPLAGPVLAAAVILDPCRPIEGLADSKILSPTRRRLLADLIRRDAHAWALGAASIEEIDEINILQASLVAMGRAVVDLALAPTRVLVDGIHCPTLPMMTQAIVRGDARVPAISAASILAKVARDEIMTSLHEQFPRYGFNANKGYPTKGHLRALRAYGPCAAHRRSFRPVRAALGKLAARG